MYYKYLGCVHLSGAVATRISRGDMAVVVAAPAIETPVCVKAAVIVSAVTEVPL
jgi:hypothetical protein